MSENMIGDKSQVQLYFALKLEDGTEVDSIFGGDPAILVIGDGNLLPGFEAVLQGLKAGDRKSLPVLPEHAFGMPNPNNIQNLSRKDFPKDIALSEGLMMSFSDAASNEVPGMIRSFNDERVEVDFNHPLAGKTLLFDVHILDVQ